MILFLEIYFKIIRLYRSKKNSTFNRYNLNKWCWAYWVRNLYVHKIIFNGLDINITFFLKTGKTAKLIFIFVPFVWFAMKITKMRINLDYLAGQTRQLNWIYYIIVCLKPIKHLKWWIISQNFDPIEFFSIRISFEQFALEYYV